MHRDVASFFRNCSPQYLKQKQGLSLARNLQSCLLGEPSVSPVLGSAVNVSVLIITFDVGPRDQTQVHG